MAEKHPLEATLEAAARAIEGDRWLYALQETAAGISAWLGALPSPAAVTIQGKRMRISEIRRVLPEIAREMRERPQQDEPPAAEVGPPSEGRHAGVTEAGEGSPEARNL